MKGRNLQSDFVETRAEASVDFKEFLDVFLVTAELVYNRTCIRLIEQQQIQALFHIHVLLLSLTMMMRLPRNSGSVMLSMRAWMASPP